MRCISGIHCLAIAIVLSALCSLGKCNCNLTSPCPRYFTYENNTEAEDRWYGALTILSDYDLNGVWLRVVFDKPVSHIRSEFGEVSRRDGNEYLIKDRNFQLLKSTPHTVRFYVQYMVHETPASLIGFRLNGKVLCPEIDPHVTTTERLYTSWKAGEHEILENVEGSNASSIDGNQEVLYTASAQLSTTSKAPDKIDQNGTVATTNGTQKVVLLALVVPDNSTNEIVSKFPEEEGTLYVSN